MGVKWLQGSFLYHSNTLCKLVFIDNHWPWEGYVSLALVCLKQQKMWYSPGFLLPLLDFWTIPLCSSWELDGNDDHLILSPQLPPGLSPFTPPGSSLCVYPKPFMPTCPPGSYPLLSCLSWLWALLCFRDSGWPVGIGLEGYVASASACGREESGFTALGFVCVCTCRCIYFYETEKGEAKAGTSILSLPLVLWLCREIVIQYRDMVMYAVEPSGQGRPALSSPSTCIHESCLGWKGVAGGRAWLIPALLLY